MLGLVIISLVGLVIHTLGFGYEFLSGHEFYTAGTIVLPVMPTLLLGIALWGATPMIAVFKLQRA